MALMLNPESMSAPVTASTSLPDNPRPSRLRRFSQLRAYTHNLSSTGSGRSSRNSLSSRVPWRSSNSGSNSPPVENATAPCPDSESPLSRYTSAPAPTYSFGDLNSHASSTESTPSTPLDEVTEIPHVMARLRSSSAAQRPPPRTLERTSNTDSQESTPSPEPSAAPNNATEPTSAPAESATPPKSESKATIRFFPYSDAFQSSQSTRPSLPFVPVTRTLPSESCVIRVGRYSERDGIPIPNPTEPTDTPVGFKSKVVSRKHCEFLYVNGQWHIKDVGSSSGTFLNHMRLSQPNMVSRLYSIKDGDIVQLGIDFRGGEEMIFRCVRIRIECNRSWQQKPNEFK
jgi:pSer/pThr/pTyr-binding forkhead associated (FHA) protein